MDLEVVLICMLHGAAGESFSRMPFQRSQEDEVARMRMWHICGGLAAWLRQHNVTRLLAMLEGGGKR